MAVALRIAFAAGTCVLCAVGLAWEGTRWYLQSEKGVLERTAEQVIAQQNPVARARFTRSALQRLELRGLVPLDVDLRLEAAAAYRLVGQHEAAEAEYRGALRVSDRPEIHIALGDLLLGMGRTDDALDHYAHAVQFSRHYLDFVQSHRGEVLARVEQRERALGNGAVPLPLSPALPR